MEVTGSVNGKIDWFEEAVEAGDEEVPELLSFSDSEDEGDALDEVVKVDVRIQYK